MELFCCVTLRKTCADARWTFAAIHTLNKSDTKANAPGIYSKHATTDTKGILLYSRFRTHPALNLLDVLYNALVHHSSELGYLSFMSLLTPVRFLHKALFSDIFPTIDNFKRLTFLITRPTATIFSATHITIWIKLSGGEGGSYLKAPIGNCLQLFIVRLTRGLLKVFFLLGRGHFMRVTRSQWRRNGKDREFDNGVHHRHGRVFTANDGVSYPRVYNWKIFQGRQKVGTGKGKKANKERKGVGWIGENKGGGDGKNEKKQMLWDWKEEQFQAAGNCIFCVQSSALRSRKQSDRYSCFGLKDGVLSSCGNVLPK